jgi:hypothetical protein
MVHFDYKSDNFSCWSDSHRHRTPLSSVTTNPFVCPSNGFDWVHRSTFHPRSARSRAISSKYNGGNVCRIRDLRSGIFTYLIICTGKTMSSSDCQCSDCPSTSLITNPETWCLNGFVLVARRMLAPLAIHIFSIRWKLFLGFLDILI